METMNEINKPTKEEQKAARESYNPLEATLEKVKNENPEIEILETKQKIRIPLKALNLLAKILKETGEGNPVSIYPVSTELTTQAAADILGCSRPHLVKLLEEGKINYTKVGRHRRVKYDDVMKHKEKMKAQQKKLLEEIMNSDEETGLYDS